MARLQIISDLHLEEQKVYDKFEITPTAPYLALLGDIGRTKDPEYFTFLEEQLTRFEIVFVILGNYEPYSSSWDDARQSLKRFETEQAEKFGSPGVGKFVFLDKTRYGLSPDITILGCTLFSHVLPSQSHDVCFYLYDFFHIEDHSIEAHNEAHDEDLAWLNGQVGSIDRSEPERKIVILTHHSPSTSTEAIGVELADSFVSSGFASDLSGEVCWMSASVKVWASGQAHFNCDYPDGSGKRVVTNSRGFHPFEDTLFDANKFIEI